ncbi:MAG: M20/M25/M40 family metallo-hydrolase, partial [Bifidobacterium castoris]|nr:M20/M25/M40 family metallo-hydrolase [Bifidobacterium castoris]
MAQVMGVYSVSDDEGPLTDMVEAFLRAQPHLTVRRHGDTLVASTDFGKAHRVVLAGHLDTVPVIGNFPPLWLEPGDPLIREDVAAAHPRERVLWGRGATDMKGSDAVLLFLAATLTDPKYELTFVFYDHEEVAAEKNGLRKVVEAHPDWIVGDFAIIGEPT